MATESKAGHGTSYSKMALHDTSADISVIITTFNRPGFLVQAIESVLSQSRAARELIVVDDGSDERTIGAVQRFGSAIQYVKQDNAGQQAARNRGAGLAQGQWLATLDDDDQYSRGYIDSVTKLINSENVDIIYTNHTSFDERGTAYQPHFLSMPSSYWDGISVVGDWTVVERFPVERLLNRIAFFPSTMSINKLFYNKIGGYNPRMRHLRAEDIEFLVRALNQGRLGILWEPLVRYRIHEGAQTAAAAATALSRLDVFEVIYSEHDLSPSFRAALEVDLPARRGYSIDDAYRARDFDAIIRLTKIVEQRHMTLARRAKWMIAALGAPMASKIADLLHKLRPRR